MTALNLIDMILFRRNNLVASFGKTASERSWARLPRLSSKAWPPRRRRRGLQQSLRGVLYSKEQACLSEHVFQFAASWAAVRNVGVDSLTSYSFTPTRNGAITARTAPIAISESALVVRNGLIHTAGVDYSYLGGVATFFIAPAATEALALYQ